AENSLLAPATVYNIVATVADALDYAHRQQIVHRDIKPANILYAPDQRLVKVSDFGIARLTDDSHTRTGEMLGSPLYMSAEQLKGQKVTGASDLYSLGVSFFQLLSGGLPFVGDSIASLSHQIINGRPRSLRSYRATLSTGSVRLVNKAIQRNPGDRYRSGAEMAEAVRRALVREFGQAALW
ncbi:MAG TPA: serine/threonine-protein kinase, partial [Spongiibacteraceae bacterium]|nr:serine/threonine-protein kinase [Spongiibacteraceae bacterium]